MLAPLDNETIFKKAFTDTVVFQQFVKDLFNIDILVDKIETEKQFEPPIANIDFKLDIYAESVDHRFVIEIQKIDYDYNFNRFLNYFISLIIEQQKKASKYAIPQTVLGVVVLTRPYKIDQLTGEPIQESVMSIDFDPRNPKDERIKIWQHQLLFLNPNPKYKNDDTPRNYQDWLDLFSKSIDEEINITLNVKNIGIAKTIQLIEYETLDPKILAEMKITESKKAMLSIIENEGIEEGIKKGKIEGRNEGKIEEKVDSAKNAIKAGCSNELISVITGLSEEQINELRKQIE
jgi:predicted transposase/invertase (TIGR01784 family)